MRGYLSKHTPAAPQLMGLFAQEWEVRASARRGARLLWAARHPRAPSEGPYALAPAPLLPLGVWIKAARSSCCGGLGHRL